MDDYIREFIEKLNDKSWSVRSSAIRNLGSILERNPDNEQLVKIIVPHLRNALKDDDDDVCLWAANTLETASFAYPGHPEIIKAIPLLFEALWDEEEDVEYTAADALVTMGKHGISALCKAVLTDSETNERKFARHNLKNEITNAASLNRLDEIQEGCEIAFSELKSSQLPGRTKEKAEMEVRMFELLADILRRKARLSKDGEILTGETIKRPKGRKGRKYQEIRRCRNG